MAAAGPLAVTFHRAFDLCADPRQAWKTLGTLGVKRILTSGQAILGGERYFINYGTYCRRDTQSLWPVRESAPRTLPLFLQAGVKEVHSSGWPLVAVGNALSSSGRFDVSRSRCR